MQHNAPAQSNRTVAVTGASGFVGRHLARELVSRGYEVRAMTTSLDKAHRVLPAERVTLVQGDIFDDAATAELMRGADAAVHLIGIRRETGSQTFQRMHAGATKRAIDAARAAGVRRFIHMSALGADPDGRSEYQRTKFEGEMLVRRSGLDWTIFRPSIIHGPDSEFMQMVKGWATGRAAPWFVLPYFSRLDIDTSKPPFPPPKPQAPSVQPVHIEDVVRAFAEAMERDEAVGEVFPLGGPEPMRWPEMLTKSRDAIPLAKKKIRPVGLPAPMAVQMAKAANLLGLGDALPFTASDAMLGSIDNVCSNTKAERQLGFRPRAFGPSVGAYGSEI